jgi:hypothetical protein
MAHEPPLPSADTLDQTEIDRLIAQSVEVQDTKPAVVGAGIEIGRAHV